MRAIWTGTVASSTRRTTADGQAIVYRLTVYDDGYATCSCKAYLFQQTRNPLTRDQERPTFRCKHLAPLFDPLGGFVAPDGSATLPPPGVAAGLPPTGTQRQAPEPASVPDDDFPDDDFDSPPIVRR